MIYCFSQAKKKVDTGGKIYWLSLVTAHWRSAVWNSQLMNHSDPIYFRDVDNLIWLFIVFSLLFLRLQIENQHDSKWNLPILSCLSDQFNQENFPWNLFSDNKVSWFYWAVGRCPPVAIFCNWILQSTKWTFSRNEKVFMSRKKNATRKIVITSFCLLSFSNFPSKAKSSKVFSSYLLNFK